jgi:hypothetical protein
MIAAAVTWLLKGWLSRWALTAEGEIKDGWRWLTASPVHFLAFALALSLAANWWLLERGNRYRDKLASTIASIRPAQAQATKDQAAVNHQPAAISAAIAEHSDVQAPAYYRSVSDAADLHRVRANAACGASPAGVPGADHSAAIDDRPAGAADLVSRPKADDDLLVAAAGRAAKMHADAQALIAAGVAVAEKAP